MKIELTREEAESVLCAHNIATGETSRGAVSERVIELIADEWPDLRAEYQVNPGPIGTGWQRTEYISDFATHEWVLSVERLEGEELHRDLYAAPEIAGGAPHVPFVTALAMQSTVVVLLPQNAPQRLRDLCGQALESADLKYRKLDENTLQAARNVALSRWRELMDQGTVWFDGIRREWAVG